MKKTASRVPVTLLLAICSFASEDFNTQEGAATGGAPSGRWAIEPGGWLYGECCRQGRAPANP